MNSKITPDHLRRRAVVYVRQSTPLQVQQNRESQRRQYGLVDHARELGFIDVLTIDDDLGRSGDGLVERPGFQRLVAEVCTGHVGAILCVEASRLARNGRDWHHLIDLCGLAGVLVIGPEGVYDPRLVDDRLVLGVKGAVNEFELSLIRQRAQEAMRQKASRGEFQCNVPVGYRWAANGALEFDPDRRVQGAIQSLFVRFNELGSARQVLMECRNERVLLPTTRLDELGVRIVEWRLPVYSSVHKILTNPVYAGAYVYGKTAARTTVVDGRAKRTAGHRKPQEEWPVLIRAHHPGYISWEDYERNQRILAENNFMNSGANRRAGRGGNSLLTGLLRCRRCGHMLYTYYTGRRDLVRYVCRGMKITQGADSCISFAGLRPDQQVAREILRAVEGTAIEAALLAAERAEHQHARRHQALLMELEQARYQARLTERRFESVDPENRLVADELETRWNAALRQVKAIEDAVRECTSCMVALSIPDKKTLLNLANDLASVWDAPATDLCLKQRIVRILVEEIVVDVDEPANQVVLLIHWSGGRHSEFRVTKPKSGEHGHCTAVEALEIVKQMAAHYPDDVIAGTLNRLKLRTGMGNTWKKHLVCSLRSRLCLPRYDPSSPHALTAQEAAKRLGISLRTVRELLRTEVIVGTQVVKFAPWQISPDALSADAVQQRVRLIHKEGRSKSGSSGRDNSTLLLGL